MTTIPKAASEAAYAVLMENIPADENDHLKVIEAAIFAALPHLGEPVEWQRYVDNVGWMIVEPEDLAHYREKGSTIRPLYPAPPAPSVAVKPLEWEQPDAPNAVEKSCWLGHGLNLCDYYIGYENGSWWMPFDSDDATEYTGLETAKAAAQANYEQRIRSALVDVPAHVPFSPAGWKLVPIEPTREMVNAAAYLAWTGSMWQAMLAAAPEPPVVCNEPASGDTQRPLPVTDDPTTAPSHTDLMVDPETFDAFIEENPPPDEPPKISLRDAAWNLLYARDRDEQAVGYRADLWDCLRAILENGMVTGPSPADAAGRLAKLLNEAVIKVENGRTLSVPEWQTWVVDACAALEAYEAGAKSQPAPIPDPVKEQMAEALRRAADVLKPIAIGGRRYGAIYSHALTAMHMIAPALAAYEKEADQ